MIALWVATGAFAAVAAGLILLRAARAATSAGSADPTLEIYRRQLGELDDLAGRGLLETNEHKAAHAEAARRLLGAADAPQTPWAGHPGDRNWILGVVVSAPLAALALYFVVGSPSLADQPLKARIDRWRGSDLASLTAPQMAAVLRQATAVKPDVEGFRFLALAENQSGSPSAAARALRKALKLAPERADLWEMLGISMVDEARGDETPSAIAAFRTAVEHDPTRVLARYHLARAQAQGGDNPGAVASLKALRADLALDDPRRGDLDGAIADAQATAKPTTGQDQMIAGMVAGLAARLKEHPDDPQGWIKLVRSYAVLGDTASRDSALAEAKARFAVKGDVIEQLETAAQTAAMK